MSATSNRNNPRNSAINIALRPSHFSQSSNGADLAGFLCHEDGMVAVDRPNKIAVPGPVSITKHIWVSGTDIYQGCYRILQGQWINITMTASVMPITPRMVAVRFTHNFNVKNNILMQHQAILTCERCKFSQTVLKGLSGEPSAIDAVLKQKVFERQLGAHAKKMGNRVESMH